MRKIALRSAAFLASCSVLAATSSAFALTTPAGMGTQGSLTVSADRLFGVLIASTSVERDAVGNQPSSKLSSTSTNISIVNPASGARVGIDYTVIPNLTIGAAFGLGFGSSSTKSEGGGQTVETDGPSSMTIILAPRVGYLIDFSDNLGLWPRAGVTYSRTSTTTEANGPAPEEKDTSSQLAATLDVPLVIAPADHFAFTVGPFLDFPLSASHKNEKGAVTVEDDPAAKTILFGLGCGILGSF